MRPILLVVLSGCLAPAQNTGPAQTPAPHAPAQNVIQLSLKKAVQIALTPEGSERLALALQTVKQSEQQTLEARSAFLPNLDGTVQERNQTTNLKTFGLNFQLPVPGFSFPALVGPFTVFDARVSVQQSVFSYADIKKYQASRAALAVSRSDADTTKNQVSEQVSRAYLACLRASSDLETAKADVDLSNALVALANRQKDAGTGTGIEITRQQVQLANDQQRLIVAQKNQRKAVMELLRAMGLTLDSPVEFTDRLAFNKVDVGTLEDSLKKATQSRPELAAEEHRQQYALLNNASITAERLPTVQAFGDYGSIGLQINNARPTREYGIEMKVNLFDGFRRDARRAESLSQYQQEKIRLRDLQQQVELDVREAIDSLHSSEAEVQTAADGLMLANNELAQAQRRYQAGVTNSIEVTDAQTRLDRARDNQIVALYDYNLARIDLATATGTIAEYVNQ
jgi:outer membrane protein TolC